MRVKNIKFCFLLFFFVTSNSLFAQDSRNTSISVDPLTFFGLLINSGSGDADFRNMWLSVDLNWETESQREASLGVILKANRVALKSIYRTFTNKERQSGMFLGLYGLIEWRKMYWLFNSDEELTIGWNFPFKGNDNVYHSIGIAGGVDIGFRFRNENFGITPYMGLGVPLFYSFGNLPPSSRQEFRILNTMVRAVNIGLKIDFFTRNQRNNVNPTH